MSEKVLFSYVSKKVEDGIKIEISHAEDFFPRGKVQSHCGCLMFNDHFVDFAADFVAAPGFLGHKESNPRKTLSWLRSMYEDLFGDSEFDEAN